MEFFLYEGIQAHYEVRNWNIYERASTNHVL